MPAQPFQLLVEKIVTLYELAKGNVSRRKVGLQRMLALITQQRLTLLTSLRLRLLGRNMPLTTSNATTFGYNLHELL